MYERFYGFLESPFNIIPDPKFLLLSPTHLDGLQHLRYGSQEKKGFIFIIREVGCGKTTLCRNPLDELKPEHWETDLIINPQLTETQLLKAILAELREQRKARSRIARKEVLARFLSRN